MSTYDPEVVLTAQAVIAAGGSLSAPVNLVGKRLAGIVSPAGVTGTTYTFEVSSDGVTFKPFYDQAGTEISAVHGGTTRHTDINTAQFKCITHLKIRTGTFAVPSVQDASRTITLCTREV